jgi:hypothetical protein
VFSWTFIDGAGNEVGNSSTFTDSVDAEDWIGTAWRDLIERGVEEVVLLDRQRGRRLYRMGLDAE